MYYYNNELPPQQGWICPKCGRVNAPWMPTCDCVSSQTSGSSTPYLVKTSSISQDSHEVADTPQTDCKTCRHYKLACELFSEVCKYEPTTQTETQNSNLTFDTPQTESTGSPIGDYRDGLGAWQTDCGWK